jgi:hypothetical protein
MKLTGIVLIVLLLVSVPAEAQCAMCRAVLESSGDQEVAKSLNNGIVYLMIIPYVLVGVTIFYIYKRFFQNKKNP